MRRWGAFLAALVLALCAAPALASAPGHTIALKSDCSTSAAIGEPLAAIVADRARWRCGGPPRLTAERAVLRFTQGAGEPTRFFATRPTRFEALSLAVFRQGALVAERHYPAATIIAGPLPDRFLVPLPARPEPGDVLMAAIDRPSSRGLMGDARMLSGDPGVGHEAMKRLLLAAVVCGMLIMPLAFNAAYFRVLRERFVLWHLVVTVGLLAQCLLTSGIIGHFFDLPIDVHRILLTVSFGISIAAAAAFCAAFIEPRKLHPRLRTALYVVAVQVTAVTAAHALLPQGLGPLRSMLYYGSYIPVLVVFTLAMADGWRRGSRAVRYQVIGWAPFIVVGVVRIVTMLSPTLEPNEAMDLFHIAMVIESIATSLGVADRFMVIKRQRDRALSRAHSLERLSERDDLTGLYNRRALDGRLGDFAAQGFTGFALFDLDNFKRVNDSHGHAVGDSVLQTVASVLSGHDDAVALRMGGEEFLLLLRGDHVQERVERLREAIPVRIAREVAELEALVTASAGLVEAPRGADIGNDFVALYRAADDLLYEAKHNGRNLLAAMTLPAKASAASAAGAVAA